MVVRHALMTCKPLVFCFLVSACAMPEDGPLREPSTPAGGIATISSTDLQRHVEILASDEFEGRLPGTRAEELTTDYLASQFSSLDLKPVGDRGTYLQSVPLAAITADPNTVLTIDSGDQRLNLNYGTDYIVWTKQFVDRAEVIDSELVFVGYGVTADEFEWDDYKGVDVRGKTLLMLVIRP